jgi:lipopolysaccharide transport system permease protein
MAAPTASPHNAGCLASDIVPATRWPRVDVRELWAYRELLLFLVWRDIKVRYAQTVLGAGWTVAQPLVTVATFSVVFGGLAKIPSDGVPYPLFSLAAMIPWSYFSGALTGATTSLVSNTNLITKTYFPRLIIPLSSVLSGVVNLALTLVLFVACLIVAGIAPARSSLIVVPLLVAITMMVAAGVGCWLGALSLQYRDIRTLSALLVQLWMYASPIVYPLSLVPDAYRPLYVLNPMVGIIEGFRSVLVGTTPLPVGPIAVSAVVGALLFASGVLYFCRMEQTFADVA